MDRAQAPQARHASREEQTRRKWAGNWVSTGQGEGQREPGNLFGSQPPRIQRPSVGRDPLRERVMGRFGEVAAQQDNPSRYGAGSYVQGGPGNVTQGLASRNLPQSVASMHSAMSAAKSLPNGLDPRTPDRAPPGPGGGSLSGTRWGSPAGGLFGSGLLGRALVPSTTTSEVKP